MIEETLAAHFQNPVTPDPYFMVRRAEQLPLLAIGLPKLFATDKSWPGFDGDESMGAIFAYQKRTRKLGAVVE